MLVTHRVIGSSMEPTLVDGELIVANPLDQRPGRFDVVLLSQPSLTTELIKRVVALPGDRIRIESTRRGPIIRVAAAGSTRWSMVVSAGRRAHWTSRIDCCTAGGRLADHPATATVPAGSYFVLGDNPDSSIDSREFGFTGPDAVRAVVAGQLWPPRSLPSGERLAPTP